MTHVAKAFMATAVLCLVVGMGWGIQMSATGDHALSPAHGHLNLLGFVVMAVTGLYYAVTPSAAASRWAAMHYGLTVAAVVILVPGIAMAISGAGETLAKIGSVLTLLEPCCLAGSSCGSASERERELRPLPAGHPKPRSDGMGIGGPSSFGVRGPAGRAELCDRGRGLCHLG